MKTELQLGYGRSTQTFAFDDEQFSLLENASSGERPLTDFEIGAALDNPIDSPPLNDLFSPGESVLIVVSDATRATGSAQIVNLLVRRLIQSGVSPGDIAIIFATGIHRRVTEDEKRELLTPFILERIRTIDHDPHGGLVSLDLKVGDHPVELNGALKEFSHVVTTGAIGFHYFAGFTGGRKSICPGLASVRTTEATHMLALDFETGGRRGGVATGKLDGNAVHEACETIAAAVSPVFSINCVVDQKGRVTRLYAGHWKTSHRLGCEEYLRTHSVNIDALRGAVIVSCGGWPWDINMIQAHKALEMAAHATTEGGTIVLFSACSDGLGRADFLKWFQERNSQALAARLRESYEVNGQTAWSLMSKAERYRIFLISDLPDEEVRTMRMQPATSLSEVMAEIDSAEQGFILPRGAALLPVVSNE